MIPSLSRLYKAFMLVAVFMCYEVSASAAEIFTGNVTDGGSIIITTSSSSTTSNFTTCAGAPLPPITSTSPASGGDTNLDVEYQWMIGNAFSTNPASDWSPAPGVNNQADYTPPALGATSYLVRCARRAGFPTFEIESNIVIITVSGSPIANITEGGGNVFGGATVDFSAGNNPGSTYSWDFDGDGFPDAFGQNPSFTYNAPGSYPVTLTVTNSNGCSTSTMTTVTVSTPQEANVADPCDCGNPNNVPTPTNYFNHDYILINSNPGEVWTLTNTVGTTLYTVTYVNGAPVVTALPNTFTIPENPNNPGQYFMPVWFVANAGWGVNVSNGLFNLVTGPGPVLPPNCVPCPNPLPVELLDFRATAKDGGIMLNWETASEENNSHFEVESSIDGSRFDYVGKVEGAGNSNTLLSYSFFVENPVPGDNYFRLRQVDFDGQNEFSPIVSIRIDSDKPILSVVPNPVNEKAVIRLGDTVVPGTKLELVSTTGQVLQVINVTNTSQEINIADLASGIYFLRVEDAPRSAQAYYKIVKQ